MKRSILFSGLALLALAAVLLTPSHAAAQTPQAVSLTLSEFMITPMSFQVTQGQPVHFTVQNTGKYPHSVTFVYEGKKMDLFSTPLKGGESGTADFTFADAGAWQMYCPVDSHAQKGMTGTLQVMAATAAPPTGMPATGTPAGSALFILVLVAAGLFNAGLLLRRRRATGAA